MKKFAVLFIVLLLLLPFFISAQTVIERDTFNNLGGWRAGYGDWAIRGGALAQLNKNTGLARIDAKIPQSGVYQVDFTIRYLDGGYASATDYQRGLFHAGFGIHVGVSNPALGKMAWGNGKGYLLWLNLDTRPETRQMHPEHYGFRAQVYESTSNVDMSLYQSPAVRSLLGDPRLSIDIMQALRNYGKNMTIADLEPYLYRDVPISIRVNTNTGEIGVKDPTAPVRFWFRVNPQMLKGQYMSLRTNSLSAAFDNFTVTQM